MGTHRQPWPWPNAHANHVNHPKEKALVQENKHITSGFDSKDSPKKTWLSFICVHLWWSSVGDCSPVILVLGYASWYLPPDLVWLDCWSAADNGSVDLNNKNLVVLFNHGITYFHLYKYCHTSVCIHKSEEVFHSFAELFWREQLTANFLLTVFLLFFKKISLTFECFSAHVISLLVFLKEEWVIFSKLYTVAIRGKRDLYMIWLKKNTSFFRLPSLLFCIKLHFFKLLPISLTPQAIIHLHNATPLISYIRTHIRAQLHPESRVQSYPHARHIAAIICKHSW